MISVLESWSYYYQPELKDTNVSFEKSNRKSAKQALVLFFFPTKVKKKTNQRASHFLKKKAHNEKITDISTPFPFVLCVPQEVCKIKYSKAENDNNTVHDAQKHVPIW